MKDVSLVRYRTLPRNVHADFYACSPGFAITVYKVSSVSITHIEEPVKLNFL